MILVIQGDVLLKLNAKSTIVRKIISLNFDEKMFDHPTKGQVMSHFKKQERCLAMHPAQLSHGLQISQIEFQTKMFSNNDELSPDSKTTCKKLVEQYSDRIQGVDNWMENARLQWMEVLEAELRLQPDGVRFQPHKLANLFMGPLFLEKFIQWIVRAYDQGASLFSWLESVVPETQNKTFHSPLHKLCNQDYYAHYQNALSSSSTLNPTQFYQLHEQLRKSHRERFVTFTPPLCISEPSVDFRVKNPKIYSAVRWSVKDAQ
jgi:hypothetical protein